MYALKLIIIIYGKFILSACKIVEYWYIYTEYTHTKLSYSLLLLESTENHDRLEILSNVSWTMRKRLPNTDV